MAYEFENILVVHQEDTVILDGDFASDCDGCGALAVLARWLRIGGTRVRAIINNTDNLNGCGIIDAIMSYYGFHVPIGITSDKGFHGSGKSSNTKYNKEVAERFSEKFRTGKLDVRPSLELYRESLENVADNSAVLITIGSLNTAAEILKAEPELFAAKVKCVVSVAGNFEEPSKPESNISRQILAARYFFENCPAPLFFTGIEIGQRLTTGFSELLEDNPVSVAYYLHNGGMCYSHGAAAVEAACCGVRENWGVTEPFRVRVLEDGALEVIPDPEGNCCAVKFESEEAVERVRLRLNKTYAEKVPDYMHREPSILPPAGHPRLMLLPQDLETVKENLLAAENKQAYAFWQELLETPITGQGVTPEVGSYHMKEYLAVEARAFRALLHSDNAAYAREAIEGLLCIARSFLIKGDVMRGRWSGHLIFVAAEVYDWCYAYLTPEEKKEIIKRCEQVAEENFEMGYPPLGLNALCGHGCESELLKDLLSFSIAVYDERPDIYKLCAGRILEEYVEANEFQFAGGGHVQGPAYGVYRYTFSLWSAILFEKMSGQKIFGQNLARTADYFLYTLRPDGQHFRLGDDCTELKAFRMVQAPITIPMFLAAVYTRENRYMQYFQKYHFPENILPDKYGMDFYKVDSYGEGVFSPVVMLLWNRPEMWRDSKTASCAQNGGESLDVLPKYRHFPYPLGMTVWKDNETQTAVIMKIGELWGGNHDHLDTGCFQVYHRGILASDSGVYGNYHTSHRMNYLIRTSAHNCITVKDIQSSPEDWEAVDGGVRLPMSGFSPLDIHTWQKHYRMAKVISHSESDTLCEITGDLTEAYARTCERVVRSMRFEAEDGAYGTLTVTDEIVAKDASFIKTFHLHTQTEPVICGNEIIITNGGGRLRCQVIAPAEAQITAVGGMGKEFLVDGVNYPYPPSEHRDYAEVGWGQVLIRPARQNLEDKFVVRMIVEDNM